jgi:autotransporter translocation and assembly factor TamB
LTAFLSGLEAAKLPGLKGFSGKTEAELRWSGSLEKPTLSAGVRMALSRGKGKDAPRVQLRGNLTLVEGRLGIQGSLNERASLEGFIVRSGDFWEVRKFDYRSGRKVGTLTASGTWPTKMDLPVDLRMSGTGLEPRDIPFLSENFPDLSGKLDLEGSYKGTRSAPRRALRLTSGALKLGDLPPEPLRVALEWVPGLLEFKELSLGKLLSAEGTLGLTPEGSLDLRVSAHRAPLGFLAGVLGWEDPPKPLTGFLSGKVRISGVRRNPLLSGSDEVLVESLQVGDWRSDRVEALLNLEQALF